MLGLGALEAAIMDVAWSRSEPVTGREVFEVVHEQRGVAYTTVLTVMNVLQRKGWLRRDRDGRGRAARYEATATREEYAAAMVRAALDGVDDPAAVLTRFVQQVPAEESVALRAALTEWLREEES